VPELRVGQNRDRLGGLVRTGQFEVDDLEALGPVERAEDMTEPVGHEAVPDARRALLRHLDPRDLGIGLAACGDAEIRTPGPAPHAAATTASRAPRRLSSAKSLGKRMS